MAENAVVFNLTQVGAEGTAGTWATPGTVTPAFSWSLSPTATVQEFRPMGYKYNTETAIGKEWSELSVEGYGCYNCMPYILSGVMGTATITAGAITGWAFAPSSTAADTDKTYTVENNGGGVRNVAAGYGRLTGWGYSIDREKFDVKASGFAQRVVEGSTATASPKSVALVPILPSQVTVFMDNTAAGLGTTRLTRVLSVEFEQSDKAAPLWVVNDAATSFVADVEQAPTAQLRIVAEYDATSGTIWTGSLRSGDRKFVRVQGSGALIAGGTSYLFQHDMALEAADAFTFGDADGVWTIEMVFGLTHDATWGYAQKATLKNTQTTL